MVDQVGENIIDARHAAESAGLVYIDDQGTGFTRRKSGKGWSYRDTDGARVSNTAVICNAVGGLTQLYDALKSHVHVMEGIAYGTCKTEPYSV